MKHEVLERWSGEISKAAPQVSLHLPGQPAPAGLTWLAQGVRVVRYNPEFDGAGNIIGGDFWIGWLPVGWGNVGATAYLSPHVRRCYRFQRDSDGGCEFWSPAGVALGQYLLRVEPLDPPGSSDEEDRVRLWRAWKVPKDTDEAWQGLQQIADADRQEGPAEPTLEREP